MAELVELPGSRRLVPPGTRVVGPIPVDRVGRMTLLLRRRTDGPPFPAVLEQAAAIPRQRRYLSRGELGERHGAAPSGLAAIRRFVEARGLQVTREEAPRRLVRIEGRLTDLAAAFGTEVREFDGPSGRYVGRAEALYVPGELHHSLIGAFGLDERPAARCHLRRSQLASAMGYRPVDVGSAYGFPSGTDGTGRCVGLLEFGGGWSPDDLATFFASQGLPTPTVSSVNVDSGTNAPTGDPSGPDGEVALDIEIVGSLAPGAEIAVYFAPNEEAGFVDALSAAIHDTAHSPTVLSISWGAPESTWSAQARTSLSSLAEDAAAVGITVVASAGDNGADDAGPGTGLAVDFPASGPFVLACGGTRLELDGIALRSETTWNDLSAGEGASGGGVSEKFGPPSFQSGTAVPMGPSGQPGRGVPDVSASADPQRGYTIQVDGTTVVLGGTSAAAPLWAALLARLGQATGAKLGLVQPLLYAAPPGTLRDITTGNNGGYSAGPGWDACTGLGTPDGAALLVALQGPSMTGGGSLKARGRPSR